MLFLLLLLLALVLFFFFSLFRLLIGLHCLIIQLWCAVQQGQAASRQVVPDHTGIPHPTPETHEVSRLANSQGMYLLRAYLYIMPFGLCVYVCSVFSSLSLYLLRLCVFLCLTLSLCVGFHDAWTLFNSSSCCCLINPPSCVYYALCFPLAMVLLCLQHCNLTMFAYCLLLCVLAPTGFFFPIRPSVCCVFSSLFLASLSLARAPFPQHLNLIPSLHHATTYSCLTEKQHNTTLTPMKPKGNQSHWISSLT